MPFVGGLARMEHAWATFTEWAADDEAVDGSQDRAFSLASALVEWPSWEFILRLRMCFRRWWTMTAILRPAWTVLLREPAYAEKPLQPVVAFLRSAVARVRKCSCDPVDVAGKPGQYPSPARAPGAVGSEFDFSFNQ